jgi:hypothetical protein
MKWFALILVVFNFSVFAGVEYSFKCTNSRSLDHGLVLDILTTEEAVLKIGKDEDLRKVYLTALSKNRNEVTYKSDSGSLVSFKVQGSNILLSNLNGIDSLNYTKAHCRPL